MHSDWIEQHIVMSQTSKSSSRKRPRTQTSDHQSNHANDEGDMVVMPPRKKQANGIKPLYDARIIFPFPKHLHKVIEIFIKLLKIKPQNKENASEDMIICIERDQDDGWMVLQPCNVIYTNLLYHCRYPVSFEDPDWPAKQSKLYRRVDAKDFLNKLLNFSMSDAVIAEGCFYLVLTQWSGHFYLPEYKIIVADQFAAQQKANVGLPMEETFETSSTFNYVVAPTMPANGCTLVDDQEDEHSIATMDEPTHGFVNMPVQHQGVAFSIRAGHLARMLKLAPEDTNNMRISVNLIENQDQSSTRFTTGKKSHEPEYTDFLLTMVMDAHVQRYIQRHKTNDLPVTYDWSNQKPHRLNSLREDDQHAYPKPINVVMTNLIKIASAFADEVVLNVHHGKTLCIRTKQVMVDVPGARGWSFDFMMTGAYDDNQDDHGASVDMNDITRREVESWDTMKPKSTIDSHGKIVRHAPVWYDDMDQDDVAYHGLETSNPSRDHVGSP